MKTILALIMTIAIPANTAAQAPLRVAAGAGVRAYDAVAAHGTSTYSINALQQLGASIGVDGGTAIARIFGDSIRFWTGSPFFRAGTSLFQLAYPVTENGGVLHLPEQFFIQWLPAAYDDRVVYRAGMLTSKTDVVGPTATPATTAARPTRTAGDRTVAPASGKRIVIIDAGHGGVDPGSIGPNRLTEKDASLMIANRLAALLRSRKYEVHMTRTRDTLISLADRPRMANRWKGDEPGALYISIHMNSFRTSSASGFETYFLSDASTEDERRVAEMENAAVKYEQRSATSASELDQVLNGLRNDFYLRASNAFAQVVQQRVAQFHPGPNRGVKRAPFRVLVGALMPAVLVEVAFISNPEEASLLGSSGFQDKVAYSLAESVDTFFRDHEPLWMTQ